MTATATAMKRAKTRVASSRGGEILGESCADGESGEAHDAGDVDAGATLVGGDGVDVGKEHAAADESERTATHFRLGGDFSFRR